MKRRRLAVATAIILAVGAAMGRSVRNGFVYDDLAAIVTNPQVTHAEWQAIPRHTYWAGSLWRPFTTAMHALQWATGHGAPLVFHLTSLLAYAGLGWLLWLLLRQAAGPRASAWWAALAALLLFLAHPVHVEVVANAVGQAELWTALALTGSVLLYLRARRGEPRARDLLALLAMVSIGIASKEQGFMIPLVLAGAEWLLFAGGGEPWRRRIRLLLPVTLLALTLFLLRTSIVGGALGEAPAPIWRGTGFGDRVLAFLAVVPVDARLVVWPWHLAAEYGPPAIPVGGSFTLRHAWGAAIVLGFIAAMIRTRRRAPWIAFGLWWTAITLAPVTNLAAPTGVLTAERLLFLPTIGLAIAGVAAWSAAIERAAQRGHDVRTPVRVAAFTCAIAVAGFTVRSAARVPVWRSQAVFFDRLVVDAPLAYRAWKVAAAYWDNAGDTARAITALRRSWQLWPHDAQVPEELGQIFRSAGRCDQAIPVFTAGLAGDPRAESLRAKLIECLLTERRWDAARAVAAAGVTAGQSQFGATSTRIDRLEARDSNAGRP